ncbi:hypothetical protein IAG44_22795 [Streptomyces roseirectus]|uniref:Uncharacterized protein n=1 Tax=Streptomyces roseirectus TaxID=2768066 RepID=A0A7H0IGP6_9ACTN|nr:hypothetical protein [Streptomyces roseirectus]QNP71962.1 hypothetical protein IAG44_22795 [Streptomyces roseirectus]
MKELTPGEEPTPTIDEALTRLRDALADVGITLPSLRVDQTSATHSDPRFHLLDLGRCNVDVATSLTAALTRAGATPA